MRAPMRSRTVLFAPSQPSDRCRPDGPVRTVVPVAHGERHAVAVLDEAGHLRPSPQLHTRRAVDGRGEHRLQVGLVHEHALRPPVEPGGGVAAELGQHRPAGVDQAQAGQGAGQRGELVGDAGVLQDAEHLVVQVHRPRQVVGRPVALQHQHGQATAREQQRRRQPHRPGADHDNGLAGHAGQCRPRPSSAASGPPARGPTLTGRSDLHRL